MVTMKCLFEGGDVELKKIYRCNGPWRPIELWDVKAPTFSKQSANRKHCLDALHESWKTQGQGKHPALSNQEMQARLGRKILHRGF
jgi:hypothetical protein